MARIATIAGDIFIHSLAVTPGLRGRGFGRAILDGVVQGLIADGDEPILLEVETQNRQALSLYRDCGFREISTYRYYHLETDTLCQTRDAG